MKRVIRRGVFETNSSSSHSLSLVETKRNTKKVKKNVSFEVRSRTAKTVLMLGLIDNAEYEYISRLFDIDGHDATFEDKKRMIERANEYEEDNVNKMKEIYGDLEKLTLYELMEAIEEHCEDSRYIFDNVEYYEVDYALGIFSYVRKDVLKFREILIKTYCELENMSKKEAMDKLYYEAYKNIPLENILLYSENKEEDLRKFMSSVFRYEFKQGFARSKNKDIVEYAKKYLVDAAKKSVKQHDGKFSCTRYFKEGCLRDCYCGFEDFYAIDERLLENCNSEEDMHNRAKELLSDNYKFEAVEMYCGSYFEGNGEIY